MCTNLDGIVEERYTMSITLNLRYKGKNGSAKKFANEMMKKQIVPILSFHLNWWNGMNFYILNKSVDETL